MSNKFNILDIFILKHICSIGEQMDYIFDIIDNLSLNNKYDEIDKSINIFIENGFDLDLSLFIGLLTIAGGNNRKYNIKNYNMLYYEIILKAKNQNLNDNEIKEILVGLERNDYEQWLRINKINKIIK